MHRRCPKVVGDGGLLFEPHDVSALANAITRVLADAELRTQLRARGIGQAGSFHGSARRAKHWLFTRQLRNDVQDIKAGNIINHRRPEDKAVGPPQPEFSTVAILMATLGILLAFGLYLATLTQRSVWTDELSTLAMFPAPDLRALVQQVADSERRPPLYFILVWSWSKIAGTNEFALRYFSLGFTTLALALWFALARSMRCLFGIRQRAFVWLAFALGVLAPDIALYGVMLRYYAFLLCLSLGLNLIFVHWLIDRGNPDAAATEQHHHRNGTTLVACWLVVALMLAYTDYSVAALIFAQLFWLGVHARALGRKLRPWVLAFAILIVAYLPQLATLRTQAGHDVLQADLSQSPVGVILKLLYPIFSYTFGETILPWQLLVLVAIPCLVLAFAGLLRNLRTQPMVRFCLLFLAIPVIFNALIQTTVAADLTFLTMASRTWFVLPLFVMLVALGIVELPTRIRLLASDTPPNREPGCAGQCIFARTVSQPHLCRALARDRGDHPV